MPVISALGKLRQEGFCHFQDILSHRVKLSQSGEEDMKSGSADLGLTGV